jgi:excisionase family DNA binding protein
MRTAIAAPGTILASSFDAILDVLAEKIVARLRGVAPAPVPAGRLLDVKGAAERIGCSPSSIRHMIQSGSLSQRVLRRFGRRVMIDREEFDRWMDAQVPPALPGWSARERSPASQATQRYSGPR